MDVVSFAKQIIAMHERIADLEGRLSEYEDKYNQLLSEYVTHSEQTTNRLLALGMKLAVEKENHVSP